MNVVACCEDCKKPYVDFEMDIVLPNEQWEIISGNKEGGGLLCGACIIKRGATMKDKDGNNLFYVAKLTFCSVADIGKK